MDGGCDSPMPFRKFLSWVGERRSTRCRGLFLISLALLGMSAGVAATAVFVQWQADRSTRSDTAPLLAQSSRQLTLMLRNRQQALLMVRDTWDKVPELSPSQQGELASGVGNYIPDFIGNGVIRKGAFAWGVQPKHLSPEEAARLGREISKRTWMRNLLGSPSALTLDSVGNRPLLILSEPLHSRARSADTVVALFDLKPLLTNLFDQMHPAVPVQLVEGKTVWYRSKGWAQGRISQQPIALDGLRWSLQAQPGLAPPLGPLKLLLGIFGFLAVWAGVGLLWTAERLRQLATTDELTDLPNRRFFLERWETECERSKRYKRPLSCLMIDVNGFKQVNDLLGHRAGDTALKRVAQELRLHLRQSDLLARYGGDEFVAALPETDSRHAAAVVEKLTAIAIPLPSFDRAAPITLSVGKAELRLDDSPLEAIERADDDLYVERKGGHHEEEVAPVVLLQKTAPVPTLRLKDSDNKTVDIALDPKETVVLLKGKVASLDELTPGRRVKAHYGIQEGREVATSIVVVTPTVSFPPSQPTKGDIR